MKIEIEELEGKILDWAVGHREEKAPDFPGISIFKGEIWSNASQYSPSTDWAIAGPIIDRLDIGIQPIEHRNGIDKQEARVESAGSYAASGPTKLIAAMRCYVMYHIGPEIEIPDDVYKLLTTQPTPHQRSRW